MHAHQAPAESAASIWSLIARLPENSPAVLLADLVVSITEAGPVGLVPHFPS